VRKPFIAGGAVAVIGAVAAAVGISASQATNPSLPAPTTPIQHVVVIYDENISFDHYFGTYPNATNPAGEPQFTAAPGTPSVNGLSPNQWHSTDLLHSNPNLFNPQRLEPSQALTCSQNHSYTPEQQAFDGGLMDKFVQDTQSTSCSASNPNSSSYGPAAGPITVGTHTYSTNIVMDYFDGNTVTGMWNYAQHFALNDNSFNTQFGPSTPGALNLISGETNGTVLHGGSSSNVANGTTIGDTEPYYDQCSNNTTAINSDGTPGGTTASMTGQNIGNLMNTAGVTWGWFQGGFTPGATVPAGSGTTSLFDGGSNATYHQGPVARPACNTSHPNIGNAGIQDYVEHHEPFQYYASTANPDHVSPSSVSQVGYSDPSGTPLGQAVNHQYDLSWFNQALTQGNLPQVSFLKPPAYENAHPGNSDPLDEQRFVADTINAIEQSQYWPNTAIIIAYDDSDGWYDHVEGPNVHTSADTTDYLTGTSQCGTSTPPATGNDRCGVGPRTPLLVISPWAKQNYVDHTFTEQSSITKFIEDNWNLGRIGNGSFDASAGSLNNMFDFNTSDSRSPAVILNDTNGEVQSVVQPVCTVTATNYPNQNGYQGSQAEQVVSISDPNGFGAQSISNTWIQNGLVQQEPLSSPFTTEQVVAIKNDQSQLTQWAFDVTDLDGVTSYCA
jgi:phospholipase C